MSTQHNTQRTTHNVTRLRPAPINLCPGEHPTAGITRNSGSKMTAQRIQQASEITMSLSEAAKTMQLISQAGIRLDRFLNTVTPNMEAASQDSGVAAGKNEPGVGPLRPKQPATQYVGGQSDEVKQPAKRSLTAGDRSTESAHKRPCTQQTIGINTYTRDSFDQIRHSNDRSDPAAKHGSTGKPTEKYWDWLYYGDDEGDFETLEPDENLDQAVTGAKEEQGRLLQVAKQTALQAKILATSAATRRLKAEPGTRPEASRIGLKPPQPSTSGIEQHLRPIKSEVMAKSPVMIDLRTPSPPPIPEINRPSESAAFDPLPSTKQKDQKSVQSQSTAVPTANAVTKGHASTATVVEDSKRSKVPKAPEQINKPEGISMPRLEPDQINKSRGSSTNAPSPDTKLDGTKVTIVRYVNGEHGTYTVDRNKLVSTSGFMKQNADYSKIPFTWCCDEALKSYLTWVETRILPTQRLDKISCSIAPDPSDDMIYIRLVHLYGLGLAMEDSNFRDTVLDAVKERKNELSSKGRSQLPGKTCFQLAYHGHFPRASEFCLEKNQLHLLLAELYARESTPAQEEAIREVAPKPFWIALAASRRGLMNKRTSGVDKLGECYFHEHGNLEDCHIEK